MTGFIAGGSSLIFTKENNKAVLCESEEVIFPKLLTQSVLKSFKTVAQLSCGIDHCLAVTAQGQVCTWGYGYSGVLGHGDYNCYARPKLLTSLQSKKIVYGESGNYHNGVVTADGQLYTWGRADAGQLGIPK